MNKIKRLIGLASDQTQIRAFGGGACESGRPGKEEYRKRRREVV